MSTAFPDPLTVGTRLPTRDGRRVGNAIVIDFGRVEDTEVEVYTIRTDFGSVLRMTAGELPEFFYPPVLKPIDPEVQRREQLARLIPLPERIDPASAETALRTAIAGVFQRERFGDAEADRVEALYLRITSPEVAWATAAAATRAERKEGEPEFIAPENVPPEEYDRSHDANETALAEQLEREPDGPVSGQDGRPG